MNRWDHTGYMHKLRTNASAQVHLHDALGWMTSHHVRADLRFVSQKAVELQYFAEVL